MQIGVDPLGGASVGYWGAVAARYRLDLTVVNATVDPTFRFMTARSRREDSRWTARALTRWPGLVALKDRFDVAFGTDP